jgi:hypothetical protein
MTAPFRSLAISSDMTFEEITRLIDERIFILYNGSPQGVYSSKLEGVYAYDRINRTLYICTQSGDSPQNTVWEKYPLVATVDDVNSALISPEVSGSRYIIASVLKTFLDEKATGRRSYLRNSRFTRWTRGSSIVPLYDSPLRYGPDCWYVTREGGVDAGYIISRNANLPPANLYIYPSCLRVARLPSDVLETPFIIEQAIDPADIFDMRGNYVNLSFYARRSQDWTSEGGYLTARIYSDESSSQGSQSFKVGLMSHNPPAFPSNISPIVTKTFQMSTNFEMYDLSTLIPSETTQLTVQLVWTPTESGALGEDYLDVGCVKLSLGESVSPFLDKDLASDRDICERYVRKSFISSDPPSFSRGLEGAHSCLTNSTGNVDEIVFLGQGMRDANYQITFYNPITTNNLARDVTNNTDVGVFAINKSENGFRLYGDATSSRANHSLRVHWLADAEFYGARQVTL